MNIVAACPSYKRPYCRTAQYIGDVHIYVDPSEADDYRRENKGRGIVVECDDGIQGNLPRVRNHILDREFSNGADVVVMMDDDITRLVVWNVDESTGFGYVKKNVLEKDFYHMVEYCSSICNEWGFGMWGVNYNQDKKLYKHFQPFSTLKPSVGQFMAFTKNDLRFDESLPLKEDYDMCLQQMMKYRGLLSFNFIYVEGDFGKLGGGTSVRRNFQAEYDQFKRFKRKWGSKIVSGASRSTRNSKAGQVKGFVNEYDFSHPIVKPPIKGV